MHHPLINPITHIISIGGSGKIPFVNGCFLGGSPIYGNHIPCIYQNRQIFCRKLSSQPWRLAFLPGDQDAAIATASVMSLLRVPFCEVTHTHNIPCFHISCIIIYIYIYYRNTYTYVHTHLYIYIHKYINT